MIILSHPTGNTFVRAVAHQLSQENLLANFYTTITFDDKAWWMNLLPASLSGELLRRKFDIDPQKIKSRPYREAIRLIAKRMKWEGLIKHESGPFCVDEVYKDLDQYVASQLNKIPDARGVYAYEDGALHSFRQAKSLGLKCFYDLPIGYWRLGRQIQREEAELNPEWAITMPATRDSEAKLMRKDQEISLSDVVFVPSTFTGGSLSLAPNPPKSIIVSCFGSPAIIQPRLAFNENKHNKLKVLFVGSLTQRKGLSYLLDAIKNLRGMVELTLIGLPVRDCPPLTQALNDHRWISTIPHEKVLEEMRRHDILAFPSLFEGLALVILEAMAQGMTIITTPNSGGSDVISDGYDGFIVPIRSSEAIAERLEQLSTDRDLLTYIGNNAQKKAAQFTWDRYSQKIVSALKEMI